VSYIVSAACRLVFEWRSARAIGGGRQGGESTAVGAKQSNRARTATEVRIGVVHFLADGDEISDGRDDTPNRVPLAK